MHIGEQLGRLISLESGELLLEIFFVVRVVGVSHIHRQRHFYLRSISAGVYRFVILVIACYFTVYVQVSADALQIEPLLIAPLVAVPILLLLLAWLLGGGQKAKAPKKLPKPSKISKKGGNSGDDDETLDQ